MASGLRTVADLVDPVGEVLDGWTPPNGLRITRVRVPLGVVAIIYENRPNVTSDAAGLCLKSGNAALLRGSSSALRSNVTVVGVLREALAKQGLPEDAVLLVEDTSYQTATQVMQLTEYVDCLIPRGGPSLIRSIRENASVPVIIDGDGNCHVYVDAVSRHRRSSEDRREREDATHERVQQLPSRSSCTKRSPTDSSDASLDALHDEGVELVGDARAQACRPYVAEATEADFGTEFLDLKMSVAVVPEIGAAIDHVNRFGTGHTEAICTRDLAAARRFTTEVDAAAVIVNASTRFTDGEEFGFGAEIGISTQKLHARGPMGLRELTTYKYVIWGNGQTRG